MLGLADRLCAMFGINRSDPNTAADIKARAGAAYQYLLDLDRPDSYYFEPYDG